MAPRGRTLRRASVAFPLAFVVSCCLTVGLAAGQASQSEEPPASAKTWLGHAAEFEQYIQSAEVVSVRDIPLGVTKPQRCRLAPGGPVSEIAFKSIKPGRYQGFWESYRSEIAAYELDKALGLEMIPPTVEKRVNGILGAAVMWVSPVRSFKDLGGPASPPPVHAARWNQQLARAKMFHDLIGNVDPNLGNWLVDPSWNLILIDHSRAFATDKKLVHELTSIDPTLWSRIEALNDDSLEALIGKWVGGAQRRAILERRDRMAEIVARLLAKQPAT